MRALVSGFGCAFVGLVTALSVACSSRGAGGAGGGVASGSEVAASTSTGVGSSAGGGLGMPPLPPGDPPSHGGTITFESIGAPGWYPSRRDPAVGPCDAYQDASCCLAHHDITSDALTPWDEDLIMTLRGPMKVAQMAVYQPSAGGAWARVSDWSVLSPSAPAGMAFDGNKTDTAGFDGTIGTECLVDVSTDDPFACGAGSTPYCPTGKARHLGWAGSKLIVLLATMPHAADVGAPCSKNDQGGWFDAPWIGLSVGELVRAGAFVSCHCYAKNPNAAAVGDGCGQFNVFEVVNDNNAYKNLGVFSTDMIDYAGYVGEGPCGPACDVSKLAANVDLIDKKSDTEASAGAVSNPMKGPGAAFRRPEAGYRYFMILLDVATRSVQLAMVHPDAVPPSIGGLVPALPVSVDASVVDAVRVLRLPH